MHQGCWFPKPSNCARSCTNSDPKLPASEAEPPPCWLHQVHEAAPPHWRQIMVNRPSISVFTGARSVVLNLPIQQLNVPDRSSYPQQVSFPADF